MNLANEEDCCYCSLEEKWKGSAISYRVTQPEFVCSKLEIETLEQSVNIFKVNNKDTTVTHGIVLVFLLLPLSIFHTLGLVFLLLCWHVIAGCEILGPLKFVKRLNLKATRC